jgi:hypothetical protein
MAVPTTLAAAALRIWDRWSSADETDEADELGVADIVRLLTSGMR